VKAWIRRATATLKISLGAYEEIMPLTSIGQGAKVRALANARTTA
jgi:hypothetical protein